MPPHLHYRMLDDTYQSIPRMYDNCLLSLIYDYSNRIQKKYKNKKVFYIDNYLIERTAKIIDTNCSRYGIIIEVKYNYRGRAHTESIYLCEAMIL